MIVNVYTYFSEANITKESHQKLTLRKQVAEVLGVVEGTVRSVISDWKKRGDNTFTSHKTLKRPKLKPDENISEILCTKILDANKKAEQLATPVLLQFLAEQGYEFSKWKLLRILVYCLGYYYSQGEC
jgi:transposase